MLLSHPIGPSIVGDGKKSAIKFGRNIFSLQVPLGKRVRERERNMRFFTLLRSEQEVPARRKGTDTTSASWLELFDFFLLSFAFFQSFGISLFISWTNLFHFFIFYFASSFFRGRKSRLKRKWGTHPTIPKNEANHQKSLQFLGDKLHHYFRATAGLGLLSGRLINQGNY